MLKIVVVDDEARQCRGLRNILIHQFEGAEVKAFTSARSALDCRLRPMIAVGELCENLTDHIETGYKTAAEVLPYFFYFPGVQMLSASYVLAHRVKSINISLAEEEWVRESIKKEDAQGAYRAFWTIWERCLENGYPEPDSLRMAFKNLLRHIALSLRVSPAWEEGDEEAVDCDAFADCIKNDIYLLTEEVKAGKQKKNAAFAARFFTYLEQHYSENLSLDELAAYFELTPAYCSALIKATTGSSFSRRIIEMRIGKAKQLLFDTDRRIYEIAELVGYGDVKYFNRVFKRETGVTPVEYRESVQKLREGYGE